MVGIVPVPVTLTIITAIVMITIITMVMMMTICMVVIITGRIRMRAAMLAVMPVAPMGTSGERIAQ
jgi:hypothetical protein